MKLHTEVNSVGGITLEKLLQQVTQLRTRVSRNANSKKTYSSSVSRV